jgi:hypothetical protein
MVEARVCYYTTSKTIQRVSFGRNLTFFYLWKVPTLKYSGYSSLVDDKMSWHIFTRFGLIDCMICDPADTNRESISISVCRIPYLQITPVKDGLHPIG